MNTQRIRIPSRFGLIVLGAAVFSGAGCAPKTEETGSASLPAVNSSAGAPVASDVPASEAATADAARVVVASWPQWETLTFDRRSEFMAGFKQMETAVDRQLAELTEKRAAMKGTVAVKDWDFAMKEMNDARTYLKAMGDEAAKATAETWDQQKAKVGQAWKRTQDAYEKVKFTTTS